MKVSKLFYFFIIALIIPIQINANTIGDVDGDNRVGLPEAVYALEVSSGIKTSNAPITLSGKIINVTIHENSTRTEFESNKYTSFTLESFAVDKKSPTSYLLIQGTLSGHGANAGHLTQGWKYGSGEEYYSQSIMYSGNDWGKIYQTTAVIKNHSTVGNQNLLFRMFEKEAYYKEPPFKIYNPNSSDDKRLHQTKSIYVVWEIEP